VKSLLNDSIFCDLPWLANQHGKVNNISLGKKSEAWCNTKYNDIPDAQHSDRRAKIFPWTDGKLYTLQSYNPHTSLQQAWRAIITACILMLSDIVQMSTFNSGINNMRISIPSYTSIDTFTIPWRKF
jgi:hypothetical protein